MYVYADIVIGINLVFNVLILYLTCWAAGVRVSWVRLIFAALIASIYALFGVLPEFSLLYSIPAKIILSLLIIAMGIGYRSVHLFLLEVGLFYIISFIIGGAAMGWIYFLRSGSDLYASGGLLNQSGLLNIFAGGVVGGVLTLLLIRGIVARQFKRTLRFRIVIELGGRSASFFGILDTGNSLFSLSRVPVVIVERKALYSLFEGELIEKLNLHDVTDLFFVTEAVPDELKNRLEIVPCQSIGGTKMLVGFRPDKLIIYNDKTVVETANVVIALSDIPLSPNNGYSALLNPALMHNDQVKQEANICA